MSIAKALLAFQADAPPIHLDATNPHFRNRYASLGGVVAAIRPALNKHGLVYTQLPTNLGGTPALRTVLMHAESGEQLEDTMPLILSKQDSQAQGSALTYGRRYALLSILGLVGDDDDDANSASAPVPSGVGGAVEPATQAAPAPSSSKQGTDGVGAQAAQDAGAPAPSPFRPPDGASPLASEKQIKYLRKLIGDADKADLNPDLVMNFYGTIDALTKKGASEAIEAMQAFIASSGSQVPALAGGDPDADIPFQRTFA